MPFGIGGVIRVHLGDHWRVGSEGYVSTIKQANNGSYVKYGWGGLLTLKADWLNCINAKYRIPSGPRLYVGFIFNH